MSSIVVVTSASAVHVLLPPLTGLGFLSQCTGSPTRPWWREGAGSAPFDYAPACKRTRYPSGVSFVQRLNAR